MRTLNILFFSLIIVACSSKNEERKIVLNNTTGSFSDCDTNFVTAIHVIEKDSFLLFDNKYYHRLEKCEEDSNENCINKKYVFVSNFHSDLMARIDWPSNGLDTIFTKQEIENYVNQEFEIPTKCYPNYTFVSEDTVDTWLGTNDNWPEGLLWFYSFSKPIVSSDKKFMLIEMSGMCGGLCGGFQTFILENGNQGWFINRIIHGGVY